MVTSSSLGCATCFARHAASLACRPFSLCFASGACLFAPRSATAASSHHPGPCYVIWTAAALVACLGCAISTVSFVAVLHYASAACCLTACPPAVTALGCGASFPVLG